MAYIDFPLELAWDNGVAGVRVTYEPNGANISSDGAVVYDEDLVTDVDPELNTEFDLDEIIEAGQHIADLLLPPGPIRDRFRALWLGGNPIRLRLRHTGPNAQAINNLLGIPWEFVYLPPTDDFENRPDFFLALRKDMSLVHELVNEAQFTARQPSRLPLQMSYFSFLTDPGRERDRANENSIFQGFLEEYDSLSSLINCVNLAGDQEEPSPDVIDHPNISRPDEPNVEQALHDSHLVHLTGHGSPDSLQIGAQADFTLAEVRNAVLQAGSALRAVIFLTCNSGDGRSVSTMLHQTGVPIVIGMIRTIHVIPAARFVRGFYSALAVDPNANVERAIAQGRINLFQEGTSRGKWHVSFGLPRLYLGSKDGQLIPDNLLFGEDKLIEYFQEYVTTKISETEKPEYGITLNPGKHEIQQKLEDWLIHGGTKWFHITGKPGSGKTTEIAKFLINQQNKGRNLIRHFCVHEKPATGDPLIFVRDSIVRQLTNLYADQGYSSWFPDGRFPATTGNAKDALIDFVYAPLTKAGEQGYDPPVIVIDGLDFIPPDHGVGNSILGLLRAYYSQLDDVARFIITTDERPDDDADVFAAQVAAVVETITSGVERYVYKPAQVDIFEIDKDLKAAFAGTKLGYGVRQPKVEPQDQTEPGPYPLLVRLANQCHDILAKEPPQGIEPPNLDPDQWTSAWGVQKLIEYIFEVVKHPPENLPWGAEKVRHFLDVVAITYSPLPLKEMAAIIRIDQNQQDSFQQYVMKELKPLFAEDGLIEAVRYFHHSLKNYIIHDMHRRNRDVTTHQLIINRFRPEGADWDDENIAWSQLPDYARRYLVYHLYELYRGTQINENVRAKRADDFLRLVCAPKFRQMRLEEVGRDAVVQEIRYALRVIYTEILHRSDDKGFVTYIDRILELNEFDLQILEEEVHSSKEPDHRERLHKMINIFQPGHRQPDMSRINELLLT